MSFTLFRGIILVIFCTGLSFEKDCPDNTWQAFNGSCYLLGTNATNFYSAENYCRHLGAHLVNIGTASENDFIYSILQSHAEVYWIGLTDSVDRIWKWYDTDTVPTVTFWIWGDPRAYMSDTPNCAVYYRKYRGEWKDFTCSNNFPLPFCELRRTDSVVVG